jgi:hypothetical protein
MMTAAMVAAETHVPAVMAPEMRVMASTVMATAMVTSVVASTVMAAAMMPAVAGERHVGHGKGAHGQRRDAHNPSFHRFLSSTQFFTK